MVSRNSSSASKSARSKFADSEQSLSSKLTPMYLLKPAVNSSRPLSSKSHILNNSAARLCKFCKYSDKIKIGLLLSNELIKGALKITKLSPNENAFVKSVINHQNFSYFVDLYPKLCCDIILKVSILNDEKSVWMLIKNVIHFLKPILVIHDIFKLLRPKEKGISLTKIFKAKKQILERKDIKRKSTI
ncbi:hypothetical protein BpHYR1_032929 [Brachionus plicatilis]|uniref:Uncharacterized protein n=1 Tax=Brachionus plicatilis TaxID=10195 RepID=A0A3M7SVZ5_BRAPC|nr:hypothetical protein BpHYR1_032929 [Brachionus plicatilis]